MDQRIAINLDGAIRRINIAKDRALEDYHANQLRHVGEWLDLALELLYEAKGMNKVLPEKGHPCDGRR